MWSVSYDLSIDTARADALFASALQISDEPSAMQVKRAIDAATSALGDLGCAARVAQEFGEHPETAVTRMRWARDEVACVFGGSPSDPDYSPRPVRPGALPAKALPAKALPASACPAPRLPGDMTGRRPGRHLLLAC
jgi:hypothetical protein